ncbi:hypothetical protein U5817_24675 [Aromatoleum evansii]|uniref:Apea-like HEPN domain-containing protein n=1 Tax=Aromatoleum evansii TaxID=59406 RepID=A0ABZ1AKG3_AROEV|nr:hypothetical protein U5817_24675 [Aromatoleum evansii]
MKRNKRYTIKDREFFESEFDRLLGVLVRHTAHFDSYIGMQLHWLADYYKFNLGDLLNPKKAPMQKRLIKLKSVAKRAFQPAGKQAVAEFNEWFIQIDKVRALRNDYVHGRWGVPGKLRGDENAPMSEAELILTFVPLSWSVSQDSVSVETELTLNEFAQQIDDAVKLFGQYSKLSEKYLPFMRLGTDGLN